MGSGSGIGVSSGSSVALFNDLYIIIHYRVHTSIHQSIATGVIHLMSMMLGRVKLLTIVSHPVRLFWQSSLPRSFLQIMLRISWLQKPRNCAISASRFAGSCIYRLRHRIAATSGASRREYCGWYTGFNEAPERGRGIYGQAVRMICHQCEDNTDYQRSHVSILINSAQSIIDSLCRFP